MTYACGRGDLLVHCNLRTPMTGRNREVSLRTLKQTVKRLIGLELVDALRLRWRQWHAALSSGRAQLEPPFYLQVGSGGRIMAGFVNMDLMPSPGAIRADIGRRIPVSDRSVKGLFAEHVFEHLDYEVEVTRFLAECRRVMLPGGRIRIVVPDAGAYIAAYASGHWEEYTRMRPLLEGHRDFWLGAVYRTRMELINAVFRQGKEHKYAYDAETLILVLQTAGFIKVERQHFGQGGDPALLIDTPERASESLYVEAVNP